MLQSRASDLRGIDHAGLDEIFVHARCGVEAVVRVGAGADLLEHNRAFVAGIASDLAQRLFAGAANDVDTDLFVTHGLETIECLSGAQESNATTRNDTFFNGSARGMQGILDASFLFLHLGFGGSTDLDDGHTTGELGQALLELLAVVVGGGFVDLCAQAA